MQRREVWVQGVGCKREEKWDAGVRESGGRGKHEEWTVGKNGLSNKEGE